MGWDWRGLCSTKEWVLQILEKFFSRIEAAQWSAFKYWIRLWIEASQRGGVESARRESGSSHSSPSFLHLVYPFIWTRSIMTTMMIRMRSLPCQCLQLEAGVGGVLTYDAAPSHRQTLTSTSRTSITPLFKACNLLQLLGAAQNFSGHSPNQSNDQHTHNVESIRQVQRTHFWPEIPWSRLSAHSQL